MNDDTLFLIDNALRYGLGRDDLADAVADSLDAAWAEAEAALPEGWRITSVGRIASGWAARAASSSGRRVGHDVQDSPAAALRALAAKLREQAG